MRNHTGVLKRMAYGLREDATCCPRIRATFPGIAGRSYKIGTDEIFMPATNGQFVPLHGAQVGGNVSISLTIASPVTIMDEQNTKKVLLPYIIDGIRQAQAKGAIK